MGQTCIYTTWQIWATFIVSHLERYFFWKEGHVQGVPELKSLQPSWTLKIMKPQKIPPTQALSRNLLRTEVKKIMCDDWSFVDPLQLHQLPLEVKSAIKLIVHNF